MKVVLAFLVWLFSFWTWKDLFLRWVRWSPPSPPASKETATEEHVLSQEGQQESELSRFLSSLPQDEGGCTEVHIDGDTEVMISFGSRKFKLSHGTDLCSGYHEFLKAVASSKVAFREELRVTLVGEESCKHKEAFGDALRQSNNGLRKLQIWCNGVYSSVSAAKCVSSVVMGNDNIQHLCLAFAFVGHSSQWSMEKAEAIEFMANIFPPHNLRILKSLQFYYIWVEEEGMEHLIKPFKSPHSVQGDFG